MIKRYSCLLWLAIVLIVSTRSLSYGHDLPRFGPLPDLGSEWQIVGSRTDEISPNTNPFRWIVFHNAETGDLLSFATFPRRNPSTPLDRYFDTALEIFPDGLAVWERNSTRMTIECIAISVRERKLSIHRRLPVMEYSFISEAKTRPNLMANGRA